MPAPPNNKGKKKKGKAPAHQNKFAFAHNPKSKTTAKILAMPNTHVCRRCHDKIEWRKQYRKYKPRTQPGTCNICKKRNVKAAYHTICDSCTRHSSKAQALILEQQQQQQQGEEKEDKKNQSSTPTVVEEQEQQEGGEETQTEKDCGASVSSSSQLSSSKVVWRACAVCVKELAIPDPDEEDEDDESMLGRTERLRLRERKAIERQLEREAKGHKSNNGGGSTHDDNENDDNDNMEEDEEMDDDDDDDDEDDPFLKAVGGADKLLTGEAYQKKLLAEQDA